MMTKMTRTRLPALVLSALATLAITAAAAADTPPANAKPISEAVAAVEKMDLGVVTSAEFDDGFWQVKARKDDRTTKVALDPITVKEHRRGTEGNDDDQPPAGAMPLSKVLAALESDRVGVIEEAEFDDDDWEIEARDANNRQVKIKVDPITGEPRPRR